ncbi:hypothetical protein ACJMK2_042028 [Sinanodonta woodiana]|uniref:Uncharacterized protein n=1 Tax=Sinanodonta woodiana TaxID=1069815 RepID=A0ABD3W625_SINWO
MTTAQRSELVINWDKMAGGTYQCSDCHMTFNTPMLLQKHKAKFCVGASFGDPDDLTLRHGLRGSVSPPRGGGVLDDDRIQQLHVLKQKQERMRDIHDLEERILLDKIIDQEKENMATPTAAPSRMKMPLSKHEDVRHLQLEYEKLREKELQSKAVPPISFGRHTPYSRNSDSSMSIHLEDYDEGGRRYNPNQDSQIRQLAENHGRQMEYLQLRNKDLEKQREDIRKQLENLGKKTLGDRDSTTQLLQDLKAQEERNQRALQDLKYQLSSLNTNRVNVIAIRQAYLQNGGNDPDILAQMAQMLAEAQAIEDQLKRSQDVKPKTQREKKDYSTQVSMLEMENERLHRELLLLQEQNTLARDRRKTDKEGRNPPVARKPKLPHSDLKYSKNVADGIGRGMTFSYNEVNRLVKRETEMGRPHTDNELQKVSSLALDNFTGFPAGPAREDFSNKQAYATQGEQENAPKSNLWTTDNIVSVGHQAFENTNNANNPKKKYLTNINHPVIQQHELYGTNNAAQSQSKKPLVAAVYPVKRVGQNNLPRSTDRQGLDPNVKLEHEELKRRNGLFKQRENHDKQGHTVIHDVTHLFDEYKSLNEWSNYNRVQFTDRNLSGLNRKWRKMKLRDNKKRDQKYGDGTRPIKDRKLEVPALDLEVLQDVDYRRQKKQSGRYDPGKTSYSEKIKKEPNHKLQRKKEMGSSGRLQKMLRQRSNPEHRLDRFSKRKSHYAAEERKSNHLMPVQKSYSEDDILRRLRALEALESMNMSLLPDRHNSQGQIDRSANLAQLTILNRDRPKNNRTNENHLNPGEHENEANHQNEVGQTENETNYPQDGMTITAHRNKHKLPGNLAYESVTIEQKDRANINGSDAKVTTVTYREERIREKSAR